MTDWIKDAGWLSELRRVARSDDAGAFEALVRRFAAETSAPAAAVPEAQDGREAAPEVWLPGMLATIWWAVDDGPIGVNRAMRRDTDWVACGDVAVPDEYVIKAARIIPPDVEPVPPGGLVLTLLEAVEADFELNSHAMNAAAIALRDHIDERPSAAVREGERGSSPPSSQEGDGSGSAVCASIAGGCCVSCDHQPVTDPAAAVPEAQDGREAATYQGLTHTCNDPDCHVPGFVKTLGREQHHPKCYQSTHTAEQLAAEGLWATLCDCKVWRLFDAHETPSAAVREGERERLWEDIVLLTASFEVRGYDQQAAALRELLGRHDPIQESVNSMLARAGCICTDISHDCPIHGPAPAAAVPADTNSED